MIKVRKTRSYFWKCFTSRRTLSGATVCGSWKKGDKVRGVIIDIPYLRIALGNPGPIF